MAFVMLFVVDVHDRRVHLVIILGSALAVTRSQGIVGNIS